MPGTSRVLGPPSNILWPPAFPPFGPTGRAQPRMSVSPAPPEGGCCLSQPQFLIHKMGMTRVLMRRPSPFCKLVTGKVQNCTLHPHHLPPLPLLSLSLFSFSIFYLAGPFSSLRHHLAHHSGRPRRPGLAPAVCQGVPAEGRSCIKRWPCRQSSLRTKGPVERDTQGQEGPWRPLGGVSAFLKQGKYFF